MPAIANAAGHFWVLAWSTVLIFHQAERDAPLTD
jgi:hypothetical protein